MMTDKNIDALKADFARRLFEEHIEEASFFYEQRWYWLDQPTLLWRRLKKNEDRLESHMDALARNGPPAQEICFNALRSGDPYLRHVAFRVLCRRRQWPQVLETLKTLAEAEMDVNLLRAITDAVQYGYDEQGAVVIEKLLNEDHPFLFQAAVGACGWLRLDPGGDVLKKLEVLGCAPCSGLVRAIGRLDRHALKESEAFLWSDAIKKDPALYPEAAIAMLRKGFYRPLEDARSNLETIRENDLWITIGADRSFVDELLKITDLQKSHMTLLGLLGDTAAVEPLMARLDKPDLSEAAARALWLITGADLFETVFIPDPVDPQLLLNSEKEKLERGEALYPENETPGQTLCRHCQDPAAWRSWWVKNSTVFKTGARYRFGRLYAPDILVQTLDRDDMSPQIRRMAYEELVVRYRLDVPFEADMYVSRQESAIARYKQLVLTGGPAGSERFEPGCWYLAGRRLGVN